MTKIKLTKKSLREEQGKAKQLNNYLPTLQLKKKLLQFEDANVSLEIKKLLKLFEGKYQEVVKFSSLFPGEINIDQFLSIEKMHKTYENIAGIEIPKFDYIDFAKDDYFLLDTPIWFDIAIKKTRELIEIKQKINVLEEKKRALQKELKDVSIRVNLFEKILIPRTVKNIKLIQIFLNDQELAAVAQAKVAKTKISGKK